MLNCSSMEVNFLLLQLDKNIPVGENRRGGCLKRNALLCFGSNDAQKIEIVHGDCKIIPA